MQQMAVRSDFTCAVVQAVNRNRRNCNQDMGLIWNSFRKEERSFKFNCPWICALDCHTGLDCSLPNSSSAPFSSINCSFPDSHSWPQSSQSQSRAPELPCALQPSLLLGSWLLPACPGLGETFAQSHSGEDNNVRRLLPSMSAGFLFPWGLTL